MQIERLADKTAFEGIVAELQKEKDKNHPPIVKPVTPEVKTEVKALDATQKDKLNKITEQIQNIKAGNGDPTIEAINDIIITLIDLHDATENAEEIAKIEAQRKEAEDIKTKIKAKPEAQKKEQDVIKTETIIPPVVEKEKPKPAVQETETPEKGIPTSIDMKKITVEQRTRL